MGAWREAVEGQDPASYGKSTLGDAAFCIAYAIAYGHDRVGVVLCAAAILRRHYLADGMDDPGRRDASEELHGDERLWAAVLMIATLSTFARADAWDGCQQATALRDAEADLREWWRAQR